MAQPEAITSRLPAYVICAAIALRGLSAQNLVRYENSSEPKALIEVFANQRAQYHIPRSIYGTFLEHIGNSVFGGVSAQLLDNPGLVPYLARPEVISQRFSQPVFMNSTRFGLPLPWIPLRSSGRRYETRWNEEGNSTSSLYVMGLPGREVGIRQQIYLPVERQLRYRGVLSVLTAEGGVTLSVSMRHHDRPDEILSQSTLEAPGERKWIKLPIHLTLPAGSVAPMQGVDFAVSVKDGGRVSLGSIRLYPCDAAGGLDPEIIQWARALRSPLLRYGGNFSSGYHWRDGTGPLDERPTRLNQAWGVPEYNEFGTDELMEFCDRIGSQPQICLNLGSGSIQEAREWVEYCQGNADTVEGRKRAANGHPEPYSVAAWEFGNELYDDTQLGWYSPLSYATRYLDFVRAIQPVVSAGTHLLATGAELPAFEKWNGTLLEKAGPALQYVTTHIVADLNDVLNRKADRDSVTAAGLALPVGVGRAIGRIRTQIDANTSTRERVKLAYTEWLFRSPAGSPLPNFDNMGGAVIAAAWLNMLAQNANWIPIANMTGLMEFGGIHKKYGRTWVTPQYWVLNLYSKYAGDTVVATHTRSAQYDVHGGQVFAPEITGVPFLDVLGTVNRGTGDLSLFVVNRNMRSSQPASISLNGISPPAKIPIWMLVAQSLMDKNDENQQDLIHPVESNALMRGRVLEYVFPPCSVTVILFPGDRKPDSTTPEP